MMAVPITLDEYHTIKQYIKEKDIKAEKLMDGDTINLQCIFLNRSTNRCNIYEVRPDVCRNFICSAKNNKILSDAKCYDKRADINGEHIHRFVPFDLLFYDIPVTSIVYSTKVLGADTPDKVVKALTFMGSDQKFFTKHNITNTFEVAQAIIDGRIKLEYETTNS